MTGTQNERAHVEQIEPSATSAIDRQALEQQKLLLEIESLASRRDLEQKKLAGEVEQLSHASARAMLTLRLTVISSILGAFTTLIVAGASGFITSKVQQLADQQHATELFSKELQDLGSNNVPARAGAVIGLTKFASADPERSAQTVTILVTHLLNEKDEQVLRILSPAIVSLGLPAVEDIAKANRIATKILINEARKSTISRLPPIKNFRLGNLYARKAEFLRSVRKVYETNAGQLISQNVNAVLLNDAELKVIRDGFEQEQRGEVREGFEISEAFTRLISGHDLTFGLMDESISIAQNDTELSLGPAHISEAARQVFLTSLVLGELIQSLSGKLEKKNLSGVTLLVANFRKVSLVGINLRNSFIIGNASESDLSHADLSGANLSMLNLERANFSYSTLTNTYLPNFVFTHEKNFGINFTAADWWNARRLPPEIIPANCGILVFFSLSPAIKSQRIYSCDFSDTIKDTPSSTVILFPDVGAMLDEVHIFRKQLKDSFPRSANLTKRKTDEQVQSMGAKFAPIEANAETFASDIFFDLENADITSAGMAKLDDLTSKLRFFKVDRIDLSSLSSMAENPELKLAGLRVEAVKNYLLSKGFENEGIGTSAATSPSSPSVGRQTLRRVSVEIAGTR